MQSAEDDCKDLAEDEDDGINIACNFDRWAGVLVQLVTDFIGCC